MSHERLDNIAWETIRDRKRPDDPPRGIEHGGRARDLGEVEALIRDGVSFDDAFESWLQEVYRYRQESFFAVPPSLFFAAHERAWMAGVVEGMSRKPGIRTPSWVESSDFFLTAVYDWQRDDLGVFFPPDWATTLDKRLEGSDPEFRRRKVIAKLRNLIRV